MLVKIYPENPNQKEIDRVVKHLKKGGLIIFPTDTVYSIGCDLNNNKAVEKMAQIKGVKLKEANFSLICSDLSHLSDYCKPMENAIFKMMKKSLPGPFTFILTASNNVPKLFKANKKTVGIRVPDNNIPREIVRELGNPMVSTSVHDDDEIVEYTTDPELIHERYQNQIEIVIDGGYGNNVASTVVDCTADEPEIIRQGLGEVVL
ncbi:L-threonylcarbamoyladenylate synthase [Flavobacteriales bacterium]|nr:L-threonylcarbamoyladenylate synthase [Flavobacteriales bacterium]